MLRRIKSALKSALASAGYEIIRLNPARDNYPPDLDKMRELWRGVERYTMTSAERVSALRDAIEYVFKNKIPGDIVECGVWKGGSMMVCALTLMARSEMRNLWLFDTFEGMSLPTEIDID